MLISALIALVLSALACSAPAGTSPTATQAGPPLVEITPSSPQGATEVAAQATNAALSPSLPPAPTTDPASQATLPPAPPAAPAANADYNGISFYRSNDLASDWTVEITPVGLTEGPQGAPSHYSFTLSGFAGSTRAGAIRVYPLANFTDQYPDHNATITDIRAFLAAPDTFPNNVPLIPLGAPDVFHARVQPMQFQNGQGVRFLLTTNFQVSPLANSNLQYVFEGFTYDGLYYVSVIMPLAHPSLPDVVPGMDAEQMQAFDAGFEAYKQGLVDAFNTADAASFTPTLAMLDELVNSITITPAP